MRAVTLVIALAACKESRPPAKVRADAAPVAPDEAPRRDYRCATAADCALSERSSFSNCCERTCDADAAYHVDELAQLEADFAVRCKDRSIRESGTWECGLRKEYTAERRDGRCVAVPVAKPKPPTPSSSLAAAAG
jgi:hypothetical protein